MNENWELRTHNPEIRVIEEKAQIWQEDNMKNAFAER